MSSIAELGEFGLGHDNFSERPIVEVAVSMERTKRDESRVGCWYVCFVVAKLASCSILL